MLKYFFCLTILMASVIDTTAQRNDFRQEHERFFRVGAKAAVSIYKMQGFKLGQNFAYNYQLGGFTQFNFHRKFGLQPEVNFAQYSFDVTDDETSIGDDLSSPNSQKNKQFNYLEIPVLVNFSVGPTRRIKLQAGPNYARLLNQSAYDGPRIRSDFGFLGGLWMQLPMVNLSARYKYQFNRYQASSPRAPLDNQSFQLGVGVTF